MKNFKNVKDASILNKAQPYCEAGYSVGESAEFLAKNSFELGWLFDVVPDKISRATGRKETQLEFDTRVIRSRINKILKDIYNLKNAAYHKRIANWEQTLADVSRFSTWLPINPEPTKEKTTEDIPLESVRRGSATIQDVKPLFASIEEQVDAMDSEKNLDSETTDALLSL